MTEKSKTAKLVKVEDIVPEFGLVLGRAIICSVNGEPYFDTDNQHIPADVMLKASIEWSQTAQHTKEMHSAESGSSVFEFPLTDEIKKAFGIECNWEGLMVAYKPTDEVLQKFISGEYTGFSVGGMAVLEDVD